MNKKFKKWKRKVSKRYHRFVEDLKWPSIASLFTFLCILLLVGGMWVAGAWLLLNYVYKEGHQDAGLLGDTFGVLNSFFSAFAFAGLIYSILLQRTELRETRQEFKDQNTTLRLQRFENTFFNLLSSRNVLLNSLSGSYRNFENKDISYANGRDLIKCAVHELQERTKQFDLNLLKPISEGDSTFVNMIKMYVLAIKSISSHLDLYLSNLSSILKFVMKTDLLNDEFWTRELYFSIIRAELSIEERKFIYYYMSISDPKGPTGRYVYIFRNAEIEHQFNEYSPEFLFHESHGFLQKAWGGFENYEEDTSNSDYQDYLDIL